MVNCGSCGRFISKEDLHSDRVTIEDVSDGCEYSAPYFEVTCPTCVTKEYNEWLQNVPKDDELDVQGDENV